MIRTLRPQSILPTLVLPAALAAGIWILTSALRDPRLDTAWKVELLGAAACFFLIGGAAAFFAARTARAGKERSGGPGRMLLLAYLLPVLLVGMPALALTMLEAWAPGGSGEAGLVSALLGPRPPWLLFTQAAGLLTLLGWGAARRMFVPDAQTAGYAWIIPAVLGGGGLWLVGSFVRGLLSNRVTFPEPPALGSLPPALVAWTVVSGLVILPLAEEMLFRRALPAAWQSRLGVSGAVLASCAVFALLQGRPLLMLPAFVAGLGFDHLARRTGRLESAVVAHAVWNALALIAGWTLLI